MKKIYLFFFLILSIFSFSQNFGEFASGVRINSIIYNTSGVTPNLINSDPGALNLDGASLGTFGQNSSCAKITAGEIKTFKNAVANVCSATLNWRVYLASASPSGSFNSISLNTVTDCNTGTSVFNDGLGACASGDQKWKDYGLNIDFVNSLLPENYILEIYYSYTGSNVSASTCETTKFISNSGANFKATFTISNPITSPTASSASICEGDSLTLTSNPSGGVLPYTFSWSGPNGFTSAVENPVINTATILNSGTYSVIATDACGVASTTQSTSAVMVNAKIDPEFDATLPAICRNGIAPLLSTTSTNGITGTWNPAIVSNTTTTTYLFTPDSGQCANSLSFTIFVVNNVTPVFTLPNSICSGATPPVLSNIANNGIVGSWNPSTVSNTATGTYNFTPSTLQCATAFSKTIIVNPLVAIFLPAIPPICSGDALAALPLTSSNGVTGTWSPAVNNTATTTYTFTPTSGQCATATTSLTVVVNPIIAIFNPVPAICSGDTLSALPTTSTNGITGTWSPALNNTATTTYTFTPTSGQCATATANLTIVVNQLIATFNPVAPICSGDAMAPLPTTSTNGITGTWSPALNNTATTTYTFTPTSGQCATATASLTIVVNQLLATFNPVAPICSGDALSALPTTSTNGITGTWSPAVNNTATTTYTFTPTGGQCATATASLTIVINPLIATFNPVAPICSGDALSALPTTSTNGITGTWSPALNNTATTTYTFTPTSGQCATATASLTIVVNPLIATFNPVAPICSGDALSALPTTSTNGITGTWSPTVNNTATTTYTFTPTSGQCATATASLTIVVNPLIATFNPVAPICSGDSLTALPTTSTNGITGTWTPALNNTATTTYTFTPTGGQCATATASLTIVVNPLIATFNPVPAICSGDTLSALPTTSTNGITGTWSPSVNNTATTTYTFTPTSGQCATATANLTIVVNPLIATFNPVPAICSGDTLSALPTTSTNGITGTWSPSVNNTATTTYTFTPTSGQCATATASLTIVVNPLIATFNPVPAICSGDALSALPTTSTNGITGTWSPALNNTATTTYTFTPTSGQCATVTASLTIVVNQLIATFNPIAPICSGAVLTALQTTSTNGITGTWSPVLNNTATTTYTFTPTGGQCATANASLTIVVNPLIATFNPVAPICSGDALAALPTTSTNGITGTWSPALNNTATTTYTFTPTSGQCATATASLTIVVNPLIATFNPVAPICSGAVLTALPTTSTNGITGTWSPAVNNTATTTYTFTPTSGQCATATASLTIVVNPLIATFNPVPAICSGAVLTALPTTSTNGITGTWSPAVNNTATTTYTFTPTSGQCATATASLTIVVNQLIATFNPVAPICSGDSLTALPTTSTNGITGTWSPSVNNTATTTYTFTPTGGQCATATANLTIVVNPLIATFNPVPAICSGAVLTALPTTSTNGITGTWLPSVNNTATTTYTFTPTSGQCATATASLTIVVNPLIASFNPVAPICSGDTLSALPTTSTNGITGTWSPAVNNTATTTYTFTPTSGQCATATASLTIVVNPLIATFNAVPAICSGDALSALPTTSNNGITGAWSPALNNTATTTYTFTPTSGQCATATASLTIVVNSVITPTFTLISSICSGTISPVLPLTSNNGYSGTWNPALVSNTVSGNYNFTPDPIVGLCLLTVTMSITVNPLVAIFNPVPAICSGDSLAALPTTSTNGVTGSWLPLMDNTNTTTYTFTPTGGQCATATASLTVVVNSRTTPTFTPFTSICSGSTSPVLPLLSNNLIAGTWNPALVSNTATATYTFTPNVGQCGTTTTLNITVNPSPTDILFATTNVINQGPDGIIEILSVTSGVSPYLYSINNSGFTSNKIYSNLAPGNYTITVRDTNGCEYSKTVLIDSSCVFPNAISPNRDSFNDTFDLNGCKINKLEIFNRYGRKVNSYIDYKDQWDGINSNGEELPDGTYFYVAEIEGGSVKSGWVFIAR